MSLLYIFTFGFYATALCTIVLGMRTTIDREHNNVKVLRKGPPTNLNGNGESVDDEGVLKRLIVHWRTREHDHKIKGTTGNWNGAVTLLSVEEEKAAKFVSLVREQHWRELMRDPQQGYHQLLEAIKTRSGGEGFHLSCRVHHSEHHGKLYPVLTDTELKTGEGDQQHQKAGENTGKVWLCQELIWEDTLHKHCPLSTLIDHLVEKKFPDGSTKRDEPLKDLMRFVIVFSLARLFTPMEQQEQEERIQVVQFQQGKHSSNKFPVELHLTPKDVEEFVDALYDTLKQKIPEKKEREAFTALTIQTLNQINHEIEVEITKKGKGELTPEQQINKHDKEIEIIRKKASKDLHQDKFEA